MSTQDLDSGPDGCGRDAGAYVLGALDCAEAESFRRHMAGCVVCRDEVATLQAVADALALAAPQLPVPRALRGRVIASFRDAHGAAPAGRPRWHAGRLRAPRAGLAPALAVAAAGVLATVGALELSSGQTGTRVVRASVSVARGSAVVRLTSGRAELIVSRMPPAPGGQIYEVWLKRSGRPPTPTTALFDVTAAGAAAVDVPGDLHGVGEVLVTPEPRRGSRAPTHAPVIVARLS